MIEIDVGLLAFILITIVGITGGIIVEKLEDKEYEKMVYKQKWSKKMQDGTLNVYLNDSYRL